MMIFKLLIIYFCVYHPHESVYAAKRIKRNFESDGNHTKISNDFAVVQSAGEKEKDTKAVINKMNITKPSISTTEKPMMPSKESVSAFNEMLHNIEPILKKRKLMHTSRSISKPQDTHTSRSRNVAAVLDNLRHTPMTYIFHEQQEKKFPEYVDHIVTATAGRSDEKSKETPAEVVIIDNAPNAMPFLKERNNLHQCGDKSFKLIEGENDENKYILKGLSHIRNAADERNRAFAATNAKIFDNQFLPRHNPIIGRNAFSPLERMFKLANMFMYNMGNDDPVPMHIPGSFLPYTQFNQAEDANDDPESIDYILNVIGNPSDMYSVATKTGVGEQSDASEQALNRNQHSHEAALIFKQPVPADDNKVVDLIENALDTLLSSTNEVDNNDEIEVRCPIHHEKKLNFAEHGKADGNTNGSKDADVIQVCSCHFIQKKKADNDIIKAMK